MTARAERRKARQAERDRRTGYNRKEGVFERGGGQPPKPPPPPRGQAEPTMLPTGRTRRRSPSRPRLRAFDEWVRSVRLLISQIGFALDNYLVSRPSTDAAKETQP